MAHAGHSIQIVSSAPASQIDLTARMTTEDGLAVLSVRDFPRRSALLSEEIRAFQPDWVLVSSEDLSHMLLREAYRAAPERIVYLAHTPQFFPFGPASWHVDEKATGMVRNAATVVAIGRHMGDYVEQHCGRPAAVIHPPIYGDGPFPNLAKFDSGIILMINPCPVKGVGIFLALADRLPQYQFGALEGWGTTEHDRDAIASRQNIRLLRRVANIEDALRQSRVLLMPSLWYEGFGLVVMEALLRGLPVIASDSGGLKEAKIGTDFVIPVQSIREWKPEFDAAHMPVPVMPEQDIDSWVGAVEGLLGDRDVYEAESSRSKEAAQKFVQGLRARDFEEFLERLPTSPTERKVRQLTPEMRSLLLRRLQEPGRHRP